VILGIACEDAQPRALPSLWNSAHPDWIFEQYPAGQLFHARGMSKTGELAFEIPSLPLVLEHRLHGASETLAAFPDTLLCFPGTRSGDRGFPLVDTR
jgi:hypothetical protein